MSHQVVLDPYAESVVASHSVKQHVLGTEQVLYQSITADSYSDSGCVVRIKPPSIDSIMNKNIIVEFPINFTATDSLDLGAPRAFPVNNIIKNCTVTINGVSTTSEPQLLISPYSRYHTNGHFRSKHYGRTPSQLDPTSEYDLVPPYHDVTGGNGAAVTQPAVGQAISANSATAADIFLGVANPNSPFNRTEQFTKHDDEFSRANFPYATTNSDTNRQYVFFEPLLHGLLADHGEEGMALIRELQIQLNFDTTLTKAWSAWTSAGDLAATIPSAPKFHVQFRRPSMPLPPQISLPFRDYVHREKTLSATTNPNDATGTGSITMDSVVLGQVPSRIFIWLNKQESGRTSEDADGFLRVDSINMTIGTRTGLLSGKTTQDLYEMCVNNGMDGVNYHQWNKRLGSPVCINVAKDLAGLDVGYQGAFSVSFTVNYTNTQWTTYAENANNARQHVLHAVFELDGEAIISPDSMMVQRGLSLADEQVVVQDKQNVANLEGKESVPYSGAGMLGGNRKGFGVHHDSLTNFGRRLLAPMANMARSAAISRSPAALGLSVLDSAMNSKGSGRLMA